jgi:hypothetical protein
MMINNPAELENYNQFLANASLFNAPNLKSADVEHTAIGLSKVLN